MTSNDEYVLEILLEHGMVTSEQVEAVRGSMVNDDTSVVDAMIASEELSELDTLRLLGEQFAMEVVSLRDIDISPKTRDMVTVETARRYNIVPIYKTEDTLTVAMTDRST